MGSGSVMFLQTHRLGNHAIININRNILMQNFMELSVEFQRMILSSQFASITLNFTEVQFIDSSGIGMLFKTLNLANRTNVIIRIINARDSIYNILRISGFSDEVLVRNLEEFFYQFPESTDVLKELRVNYD
jgi:anti-anti-sigma factor